MVGLKPADVPPSAAVKFLGAGTAACIADLLTFPLDTAKVRLQVQKKVNMYVNIYMFAFHQHILHVHIYITFCV